MALPWQRRDVPDPTAPARRRDRRRNRASAVEETRQQSTRLHEERRRQRLAITIGGMLILVIVGIVVVGYYKEFFEPPRVMAGEIRGVRFTMGDLVERLRVEQGINRYNGGFVDLSVDPFQFLQDLLFIEIVRQAAPGLGLTATDEAIEQAVRANFYPRTPPGQETDPDQLEREFNNTYQNFLTQVRLTDKDLRRRMEEQILLFQLRELLGSTIPEMPEQVEVEWIRLDFDSTLVPKEVRDRLDNEEFGDVAIEVGLSAGFADENGYVGWVPQGAFPDLDQFLFGGEEEGEEQLEVGAISDPEFGGEASYIIRIISGPEERELEPLMRAKLTIELVEAWRSDQINAGSKEKWLRVNFNSDRYAWVADQVALTAPRTRPGQQQPNQGGLPIGGP